MKWLSDALPVLILTHYEYDDPNEGETKDEEGNPLPTLADLEKGTWGESSIQLHVLRVDSFSHCISLSMIRFLWIASSGWKTWFLNKHL